MRSIACILFALCTATCANDFIDYFKCQICEIPQLSGKIQDCHCDAESVSDVNSRHILPALHELTQRTYFRYFKVDLWKSCPFWEDDGMCHVRNCAVCECEPQEIPQCWSQEDEHSSDSDADDQTNEADEAKTAELSRVEFGPENGDRPFVGWNFGNGARLTAEAQRHQNSGVTEAAAREGHSVWTEEQEGPDVVYVNLLRNPEAYTAYAGPSAARIWKAIYSENCFSGTLSSMCFEERVFYRLLSGLQTSINTHIAMTYGDGSGTRDDIYTTQEEASVPSIPTSTFEAWRDYALLLGYRIYGVLTGHPLLDAVQRLHAKREPWELVLTPGVQPNIDMYVERIAKYPERLENLYFVYLFVLRAVAKARPYLTQLEYVTGNPHEDTITRQMVSFLVGVDAPNVLRGFDETSMFREDANVNSSDITELLTRTADTSKAELRRAWLAKYQNISRIMDCVGCEKCRLWGKLQFLGLGTAIKILLFNAGGSTDFAGLHLSRNELVALINVLHRLSMSVSAITLMRDLEAQRKFHSIALKGLGTGIVVILTVVWITAWRLGKRKRPAAVDTSAEGDKHGVARLRSVSDPITPHGPAPQKALSHHHSQADIDVTGLSQS